MFNEHSLDYCCKDIDETLLNGIEQHSRDNDYLKISLAVGENNITAQRLYNSCDYDDYQVVLKGLLHLQKCLV